MIVGQSLEEQPVPRLDEAGHGGDRASTLKDVRLAMRQQAARAELQCAILINAAWDISVQRPGNATHHSDNGFGEWLVQPEINESGF